MRRSESALSYTAIAEFGLLVFRIRKQDSYATRCGAFGLERR